MNWRTVLTGLIGGILLSAALEYPLHQYLPVGHVEGWPAASVWLAILLLLAGILILIACGALAAFLSGASNRREAAATGAWSGILAALVAEVWVGGAAAGVWGNRAVLSFGLHAAQNNTQYLQLLLDATVETMWWTFGSVWIALIAGLALGALGGGLVAKGRFGGKFSLRVKAPIISLGMLCTAAATIFTVLTFSILGPHIVEVAGTIEHALPYPASVILLFPAATCFFFLIVWQVLGILTIRRGLVESPEDQAELVIAAWLYGWTPFATTIPCLLFMGTSLFTSPLAVGVLLSLVLGVLTLLQGWSFRSLPIPPVSAERTGPLFYLSIILLGGAIAACSTTIGILPYAVNVEILDIPLIATLTPPSGSAVISPSGAAIHSLVSLVDSNYMQQRMILFYLIAVCLAAGLLTAGAVWFIRHGVAQAALASPKTGLIRGAVCFVAVALLLFLVVLIAYVFPMYYLAGLTGS